MSDEISSGTITQGHAPPGAFADLVEVARPGAPVVFALRSDAGIDPDYWAMCARLEAEGKWRHVASTADFPALPIGDPEVLTRGHVFEVL